MKIKASLFVHALYWVSCNSFGTNQLRTQQQLNRSIALADINASVSRVGTNRKDWVAMFSSSDGDNGGNGDDVEKSKIEVQTWNPLRLAVLRLGLTELRFTSPLNYGKQEGSTFTCAYCGNELFDSEGKYDSGSGWPSFWRSTKETSIGYKGEFDGRLECRCGRCKSHLGHVFLDGPRTDEVSREVLQSSPSSDPRSKSQDGRLPRFCVNGAALKVNQKS